MIGPHEEISGHVLVLCLLSRVSGARLERKAELGSSTVADTARKGSAKTSIVGTSMFLTFIGELVVF
jgi:hypothetical protein